MTRNTHRAVFILFFLSGFCGLLYQVIWIRLAFASFGILTQILSVVISVFMLGLSLGAWAGGKWIRRVTGKTNISAIFFYAAAELMIGIGAFVVPWLFSSGEKLLLPLEEMSSGIYLFLSATALGLSILPWCILMGFTFPFMMAFVKNLDESNTTSFSFLYLANVLGAMFGTALTAVVLVELLGFSKTLCFAAICNFAIAFISFMLGRRNPMQRVIPKTSPDRSTGGRSSFPVKNPLIIFLVLFTTGLTALAMEVVWTRAFTPVLNTTIYSFAMLLATYLFATWLGSLLYRRHFKKSKIFSTAILIGICFVFSFLPVVLNDPRLHHTPIWVLLSIFPFCATLGYLTPKLIDKISSGYPNRAGQAYAVNIVGGVLGPLFAAYFLIPAAGVRISLILLALPYLVFYLIYFKEDKVKAPMKLALGIIGLVLALTSGFISFSYEDKRLYRRGVVLRDHTATVVGHVHGGWKILLINGIPNAILTHITKFMGHLPLAIRDHKPENALVICFGAGTTFRSLLSWDIESTAVELVPSVVNTFGYFYSDAADILKNPKAKIVIDDGRRFLKRTTEKFDVITLDPPSPVEAAGSSLLYSKEFYALAKTRLKPGGILQQWFPKEGEKKILQAVARSLMDSFPHVRVYLSISNQGYHFLASMRPFSTPTVSEMIKRLPEAAKADLLEQTKPGTNIRDIIRQMFREEMHPSSLLNDTDRSIYILDDRPFNEYYLLRRQYDRWTGNYRELARMSHQVLSRNVEDACVYKARDGRTPEAYLTVR